MDLEEIGDYIALDNPRRAVSFIREIRQHCEKIADGPHHYAARPNLGNTIRICTLGNYLIVFELFEASFSLEFSHMNSRVVIRFEKAGFAVVPDIMPKIRGVEFEEVWRRRVDVRRAACQPMGRAGRSASPGRRRSRASPTHLEIPYKVNKLGGPMRLFCCALGPAKPANLLRCESAHGACAPLSCSSPVCRSGPRSRGWLFQVTVRDRRAKSYVDHQVGEKNWK
jgi:toxin ParE1/3/4